MGGFTASAAFQARNLQSSQAGQACL